MSTYAATRPARSTRSGCVQAHGPGAASPRSELRKGTLRTGKAGLTQAVVTERFFFSAAGSAYHVDSLVSPIDGFSAADVLVVGDLVLDCWLSGPSRRLCREAPVPVVQVDERQLVPGAAGNTAANIAALGGRPRLLSVVGDDEEGEILREQLRRRGVPADDVLVEPGRQTVVKHRVMTGSHMHARFDEGDDRAPQGRARRELLARLDRLVRECPVVLACDYRLGLVTEALLDRLAAQGRPRPRLLVVDAHEPGRWARTRPSAVTPSFGEISTLLDGTDRVGPQPADRAAYVLEHGELLLDRLGAQMAAVTLDRDGAILVRRGYPGYRVPAPSAAPDTRSSGAGDAFAAAFTLALASGADGGRAVELGASAASVAVREPGTSVCDAAALRAAIAAPGKVLTLAGLADECRAHRAAGRRVVVTNGCFDVLHRGHVTYLREARRLGDVLVVGLNNDAGVRRLKGPDRPVNTAEDRAAVLAALDCVDHVVVFDSDTAEDVIAAARPDVYVKGGDYTPQMLPEAPLVESLGGEVCIMGYVAHHSSTAIIRRMAEVSS